jgi:hypothetical protein
MNNQSVGQLLDDSLLLDIHSLVAGLTLEVIDDLSLDELLEPVVQGLLVLHFD